MWCKCFVSPVAKQMTSNTIVAMRDVIQMCMFCLLFNSNRASCVAELSVIYSLLGCSAFIILLKAISYARVKKCKIFWPRRIKSLFTQLTSIYVWIPGGYTMLCVVQALPFFVRGLEMSSQDEKCSTGTTNKFLYASIEHCTYASYFYFLCLASA